MNEEHYAEIKKGPTSWNAYVAKQREASSLWRADLWNADLQDADLWYADLQDADLWYAKLRQANLRQANLRQANLDGADLRRANLRRANLDGANLTDANLTGADLTGANLDGADLRRANLRHANLRGANLRHANLEGADLLEVSLDGVILDLAIPAITDRDKAAIAKAVRGEHYDQADFGEVCGTYGCLAFHIVKTVQGGEVFAAWYRNIPFAATLIWPEAAHLFYQVQEEPVLKFTEEFLDGGEG